MIYLEIHGGKFTYCMPVQHNNKKARTAEAKLKKPGMLYYLSLWEFRNYVFGSSENVKISLFI